MRGSLTLGTLGLLACHPSPPVRPGPSQCSPDVPSNAEHPIATRTTSLAGDYTLIQIRTQPTHSLSSGRLHLAPLDSTARAGGVGGAVRDLVGWLQPTEGDSSSRPDASSRDPRHPGAVLAGQHLLLGQSNTLDGHFEQLTITAVAPQGFWGWWKAEPGWEVTETETQRVVPDPAGYFCALRVAQER
jgi:hypothetical protein